MSQYVLSEQVKFTSSCITGAIAIHLSQNFVYVNYPMNEELEG
jgi:hypothetical protein